MKTGPVTDAQQMKQCVYNIPCDCGWCYTGKTSRPLEVHIKEHKYNLTQGLLEKSKSAHHAYKEGDEILWHIYSKQELWSHNSWLLLGSGP
jgi:hypothetical protein